MRGEFQHSIDQKGRLVFPAKLREELGEGFYMAKGLDGCLFVFPAARWEELEAQIARMPIAASRRMQRFFVASAVQPEPDSMGRVLVPQALREYAGLTKDIVTIGLQGRAEIWDRERWQSYCEETTSESIASAMEELGI